MIVSPKSVSSRCALAGGCTKEHSAALCMSGAPADVGSPRTHGCAAPRAGSTPARTGRLGERPVQVHDGGVLRIRRGDPLREGLPHLAVELVRGSRLSRGSDDRSVTNREHEGAAAERSPADLIRPERVEIEIADDARVGPDGGRLTRGEDQFVAQSLEQGEHQRQPLGVRRHLWIDYSRDVGVVGHVGHRLLRVKGGVGVEESASDLLRRRVRRVHRRWLVRRVWWPRRRRVRRRSARRCERTAHPSQPPRPRPPRRHRQRSPTSVGWRPPARPVGRSRRLAPSSIGELGIGSLAGCGCGWGAGMTSRGFVDSGIR